MEQDAAAPPGRWETAALGVLLLLTLGALWWSLRYPAWGDFQPGPGLFPAIAAGLAALCAAAVFTAALLARRGGRAGTTEPPAWRRLLVYAGVVLFWAAGFAALGFVVSSLAALTMLLRLGEGMRWPASLGIAGLTVALGWLLFERLLGVPMPHGVLPI